MKLSHKAIFVAAGGVLFACGCLSQRASSESAEQPPAPALPQAAANATAEAVQSVTPPSDGFAWDALARMASQRSRESQLLALQIKCDRLENRLERTWKDPQLRVNASQSEQDENVRRGRSRHEDGDSGTVGMRFYISSPFVNRWIRKQSAHSARLLSAAAEEIAYAIYCETKALCLESALASDQIRQISETLSRQQRICAEFETLTGLGYAFPLKVLKAELKLAEIELKLAQAENEHRNLIYQLALLTGLEAGQLKLQTLEAQKLTEPDRLSIDELTAFAILSRPDIKRIQSEVQLARTELQTARARHIPWFDFVEGSYRQSEADSITHENRSRSYESEEGDEWTIRTAINIPLFTWRGDEVNLANANLNAVLFEEVISSSLIRSEIRYGVESYQAAYADRIRQEERAEKRLNAFTQKLREVESSNTLIVTDMLELEEQFHSYRQSVRESFYICLKLKLELESVVGGRDLN